MVNITFWLTTTDFDLVEKDHQILLLLLLFFFLCGGGGGGVDVHFFFFGMSLFIFFIFGN